MEEGAIKDATNLIKCALCNATDSQLICEECQINVCIACVGKHMSDLSIDHKVVPYLKQGNIPKYLKCQSHPSERCELHCQRCDKPVCNTCLLSNTHNGHFLTELMEVIRSKKGVIEKDFEEIQHIIYPKYEEILVKIKTDQSNVDTHFEDLTKIVTKQGEEWHSEIDKIVSRFHKDILEKKDRHVTALKRQEESVACTISEIRQSILDLKRILDFKDLYSTAIYKSKNPEFNKFPEKLSFPRFLPKKINTEQISRQFGVFTAKSHCSFKSNLLLKKLEFTKTFACGYQDKVEGLACLSEYEIWTFGDDGFMKLYSDEGELLQSIRTTSGERPRDIAVTKSGDLVYIAGFLCSGTVKILEGKQIKEVIKLNGVYALNVCTTSSGELLVMMKENKISPKVVRYCGTTEKQTIQFNDDGQPLYSSGFGYSLVENTNFDICVADKDAHAVVVVNQDGKLKYRYTGQCASEKSFDPTGIATDSQSRVLIAASWDRLIHILDQGGQLLSLIDIHVSCTRGICIDANDNLLVADINNRVSKIKYCS